MKTSLLIVTLAIRPDYKSQAKIYAVISFVIRDNGTYSTSGPGMIADSKIPQCVGMLVAVSIGIAIFLALLRGVIIVFTSDE